MIAAALLAALPSLLEPHNLPGCGTYPRPLCFAPDTADREFRPSDRRYVWPLEANNPPLARITYHASPDVYGPVPASVGHRHCLIDEAANSADCWSLWEVAAMAYCRTDRWMGIGKDPADGRMVFEHPVHYHEYRAPIRWLLWTYQDPPVSFPVVYAPQPSPHTPPHAMAFQVDRMQRIMQTPSGLSSALAMLWIKEADRPLFSDAFDWHSGAGGMAAYGGGTGSRPIDDISRTACVGQIVLADWCGINPNRPECHQ